MRLLTKITALYLLTTLLVFAAGGVIAYLVIKEEIDAEHQRFLRRRLARTAELIEQGEDIQSYDGAMLEVVPLGGQAREMPLRFSDTLVWHPYLKRMETNYKASIIQQINGQYYYLETFDVIVEADDITEAVVRSLSRIFVLLLIVVGLIGALFSARIFKPFNATLNRIRDFRVRDKEPLRLTKTNTKEFKRLNYFVEQMAGRSRREYQALKEFSENASHEMQTPLAIARGKLELLLDSPQLEDKDLELVLSAQQSIQKLSKLGHSLALLAKIENEEFHTERTCDFSTTVKHVIQQFEELIPLKSICLNQQIIDDVTLQIDPVLADVLVTNIVQNAVRHNIEGGSIDIVLDEQKLVVRNTGAPLSITPHELFQRFRKDRQSSESLGLGLAIVHRICELNNLDIQYRFLDDKHIINIRFPA